MKLYRVAIGACIIVGANNRAHSLTWGRKRARAHHIGEIKYMEAEQEHEPVQWGTCMKPHRSNSARARTHTVPISHGRKNVPFRLVTGMETHPFEGAVEGDVGQRVEDWEARVDNVRVHNLV